MVSAGSSFLFIFPRLSLNFLPSLIVTSNYYPTFYFYIKPIHLTISVQLSKNCTWVWQNLFPRHQNMISGLCAKYRSDRFCCAFFFLILFIFQVGHKLNSKAFRLWLGLEFNDNNKGKIQMKQALLLFGQIHDQIHATTKLHNKTLLKDS